MPKISPFEQQCLDVIKQIKEYKLVCEANVVAMIWKDPEKLRESNLSLTDFDNNVWKVYFVIADQIIMKEGKNTLDEIIVGSYLEQHLKLKQKYEEYGGFSTIETAGTYIKDEAYDGYLAELRKWSALIKLAQHGWVDKDRMSEYADMSAEQIYDEYQVYINDIFVNIDNEIKSYDVTDGIYDLIEELDEGFAVGLPYYHMPMLSQEIGGQYLGSITLVGGLSNVGKSTFARTATIPSIIENKERIVIMLNEDGIKKWQRELLVFVANNILGKDIQKHVVRDGRFSDEVRAILHEAADWLKENTQNHTITIIPFQNYKTANVIKIIKKYSSMGVKYFLLDTFKMDAGRVSEISWLDMQQKMVEISDVIKPEANNVHIMITFQLAKGSANQRFYTQDNIGLSKNMVDVASTCIMIRNLYDDECPGERNELKVYRLEGKNGRSKIPVTLDRDKHYQVIFIIKNREGSTSYQIVLEHDMSRNTCKEVGVTTVERDWA